MKTRIRTGCLVLAMLFIFVMMFGCGAGGETPKPGDTDTLGEDEVVDMGGYEFTVATAWLRNKPPRNATTFERLWHQQKE